MQEIWKDIKRYEGYYQASDQGRVKSLERKVSNGSGFFIKKERILKLTVNSRGYLVLNLCKNNQVTRTVHTIVAETFIDGYVRSSKMVVDHINNIKTDNRLSNLQLISQRENTSKDKFRINSSSKYTGVHIPLGGKKWRSTIMIKGKTKSLGSFNTELEAHYAYQKALKNLS